MGEEIMRRHYDKTPKDILINLLIESRKEVEKLQKKNKNLEQKIQELIKR